VTVPVRAVRAYVEVESEEPVTTYTGRLVKTLVYTLSREVRLLHGLRGVVSPIHISPLFRPGRRDYELGEVVTPLYVRRGGEERLVPVTLGGEYVIHIGGEAATVEAVVRGLERLKAPLALKFGDNIVTFKLAGLRDVTGEIMGKSLDGDRVTLYLKAPAKIFNVLAPSKLPKFSINAYEVLATPYLFHRGTFTLTQSIAVEAMRLLGLLVETYYSLSTVKPVLVPYKSREPALAGKVTYIIDTGDERARAEINAVLNTAEAVGVGETRQNGFGTVAWASKG
jgi:hypothetical protein